MCVTCCFRYALVSVNCVKADLSAAEYCAMLATVSMRFFYSSTFPVNPCFWAVLDCISFWIMYSLLKRKQNLLKVFWISGGIIHSIYANRYFPVASTKLSAAFINCSDVNAVPPSIAKRWHYSNCLKWSEIGRCDAMGVVMRVVFTCNSDGIKRPYNWYKWRNTFWSDLAPKPNVEEWLPAK